MYGAISFSIRFKFFPAEIILLLSLPILLTFFLFATVASLINSGSKRMEFALYALVNPRPGKVLCPNMQLID